MNAISRLSAALLLAAGLAGTVTAQDFPSKPIRIVVPYAAGGATDIIARQISVGLTEQLGQPIIIDNRPGAGGGIGTALVAKSAPDGYTIVFGNIGPNAIFPAIYPNLTYDPEKDFAPICVVVNTPLILVVRPQTPVNNVRELIAYGKANAGKVFYGSVGIGAMSHVASELFNLMAGTKFIHVPYKGSAPASLGAISGETTMYFGTGPKSLRISRRAPCVPLRSAHRRALRPRPTCPPSLSRACPDSRSTCGSGSSLRRARRVRSSTRSIAPLGLWSMRQRRASASSTAIPSLHSTAPTNFPR